MGSRAGARPAAWLAASFATGQQEEEQGRAGSTGARAGAQGLARGPYRGRAPLSGVRLAGRPAAAAGGGSMSKFSGTTCLQEGEEARWAHSLHTDLPKHCTHKPRETAEEGFGEKEKATDFHTNNLDRADWEGLQHLAC